MPFITDNQKLDNPFLKRSTNLLPCQKEMIRWWRDNKGYSYKSLAKMFGVSKRLIQFVCNPDKHKENLKRRQERGGWKQYYNKEYFTEAIREHRRYKYNTLNKK